MKVEIESKQKMFYEMEPGQVGLILDNGNHPVLRIQHFVISLWNPELSWPKDAEIQVQLLPPGTQIMLTTEV